MILHAIRASPNWVVKFKGACVWKRIELIKGGTHIIKKMGLEKEGIPKRLTIYVKPLNHPNSFDYHAST